MIYDIEIIAKVISPIITLIVGAILKYFTEKKSKIVSFISHISSFTIRDENKTQVYTHSIVIRNVGKKSANNVRVGHNFLPPNIQVFPPVKYLIEENPEGGVEIVFPIIVPKEQITISYLYFPPITWNQVNAYTKSDDGFADILNVITIPQPSKFIVALTWFLMFVGTSFLIYWLVKFIPFFLNS